LWNLAAEDLIWLKYSAHTMLFLFSIVFLPENIQQELSKEDFQNIFSLSPHHLGIPEALRMMDVLELSFPKHFCALAMKVENPYNFGEGLSDAVVNALQQFVERAERVLQRWKEQFAV